MVIDLTPLYDQIQSVYDMQTTIMNSQTDIYANFDKLTELCYVLVFADGGILAVMIFILIAILLKREH